MKKITEDDIKTVESELAAARRKYEATTFNNLDEKLAWIRDFFNKYVPELEERFMTKEELEDWIFLPNELRLKFYLYFPEHGLNMANACQQLAEDIYDDRDEDLDEDIARSRRFQTINRSYFRHWD